MILQYYCYITMTKIMYKIKPLQMMYAIKLNKKKKKNHQLWTHFELLNHRMCLFDD